MRGNFRFLAPPIFILFFIQCSNDSYTFKSTETREDEPEVIESEQTPRSQDAEAQISEVETTNGEYEIVMPINTFGAFLVQCSWVEKAQESSILGCSIQGATQSPIILKESLQFVFKEENSGSINPIQLANFGSNHDFVFEFAPPPSNRITVAVNGIAGDTITSITSLELDPPVFLNQEVEYAEGTLNAFLIENDWALTTTAIDQNSTSLRLTSFGNTTKEGQPRHVWRVQNSTNTAFTAALHGSGGKVFDFTIESGTMLYLLSDRTGTHRIDIDGRTISPKAPSRKEYSGNSSKSPIIGSENQVVFFPAD